MLSGSGTSKTTAAIVLIVALIASVVPTAGAQSAASQPNRLREPVYGSGLTNGDPIGVRNFPDPSVLRVGRNFFAYSTSSTGADSRNIAVMKSRTLAAWTFPGGGLTPAEALPNPPAWAWSVAEGGEFWAPTVASYANNPSSSRYVMYFGARHRSTPASQPTWCIGYATAASPAGPFTGAGQPLFCHLEGTTLRTTPKQNNGSIDPQIYRSPDGATYLHWKAENNHVQLWGVRLREDGQASVGQAAALVPMDGFDRTAWEFSGRLGFTILENPAMDRDSRSGKYFLFYSGGEWQNSTYSTGYATCDSPLGPCQRITVDRPWLVSRGDRVGPGGLSVVQDAKGRSFAAFHSWEQGEENTNNGRGLHVEPLAYVRGQPKLGNKRPVGSLARPRVSGDELVIRGWAWDPDTGKAVTVRLEREGERLDAAVAKRARPRPPATKFPHAGTNRGFDLRTPNEPGRYCVFAIDDRSKRAKRIGCRTIR